MSVDLRVVHEAGGAPRRVGVPPYLGDDSGTLLM